MEGANTCRSSLSASGSRSAASNGTSLRNGMGISLEAYQAIRAAVAEEVALTSNLQLTASESGAVVRERGERGEGAPAHGTVVVS